jgi:hypothetical protein
MYISLRKVVSASQEHHNTIFYNPTSHHSGVIKGKEKKKECCFAFMLLNVQDVFSHVYNLRIRQSLC